MEGVAVVGVAQTKFERRKRNETFADLVYEVTVKALEDAGMTIRDVENVVTVSNDFWDGRTISSMAVQDACGSRHKDISTVEGDGLFGVLYGAMRILSGSFSTTLVVAHHKGSEGRMPLITNAMFDPVYTRMVGLDSLTSAALQARVYMDAFGVTEEQCALVSVQNHGNARANPFAQLPLDLTVADVMASPVLSDPIKLLDACPVSDGAAAAVLASGDSARKARKKPVWLRRLPSRRPRSGQVARPAAGCTQSLRNGRHPGSLPRNRRCGTLRRLHLPGTSLARRHGLLR